MNRKIQELIHEIEGVRQNLYDSVATLSQEQMDFKASADAWSISEVLSHLNVVEKGLPKLYAILLAKAAEADLPPETEGSMLNCLDEFQIEVVTQKMNAPERVLPQSGIAKADLLASLQQSRQAVLAALAPVGAYDLSAVKWAHPFFGEINFYQWVLFIGKHEQRHLGQIQAIQQAENFPAS
jgi:uncharacterized damage-inducible protein DinB